MSEDTAKALARASDPITSHKVPKVISRQSLRMQVIVFALDHPEGFTDGDLVRLGIGAESSMRKRRSELTQENRIIPAGRTALNHNNRRAMVWIHRNYAESPAPIRNRSEYKTWREIRFDNLKAENDRLKAEIASLREAQQ